MDYALEIDYENPWLYNGLPFTSDDIGDYYGFVYRITNLCTGKQYIGRKYFGSSEELKRDIREIGKENFRREIISLHQTLGKVNYEETRQLFLNNVLMESLADGTPLYYNSNILGRYMKKDYYDKLT